MTRSNSISSLPVSAATRRLNPGVFDDDTKRLGHSEPKGVFHAVGAKAPTWDGKKRLRQDPKPLMNALETRLFCHLQANHLEIAIRAQAKRYRLANGIWYKPDFTAIVAGVEHAWEAKGPRAFRGGFENLKVAAAQYPEVTFILVWEEGGRWAEQRILP